MAEIHRIAPSKPVNEAWVVPLIFLINLVVYYLSAYPMMDDPDVPWHLATGRYLLETHHVPTQDPWSFASQDQPWYLLSWVWDLLIGITERISGLFGVRILSISIGAGIIAALTALMIRQKIALPAIFMTMLIASVCMMDFVMARPQMAGYALVLVFYTILGRSRERPGYERLLWLPPLMLIWANTHGSFIAGFSVLGAFIVDAFFSKNRAWLKRLIIIFAICCACALINPYGPEVILGAMRTLNGSFKAYNMEWQPYSFSASMGVSAWLILFVLSSNLLRGSASIADKILAFIWLVSTLFVIRNGPIMIILSAPYLATCIDEGTKTLRQTRAATPFALFMEKQPLKRVWIACGVAFVLFVSGANALPHQDKIMSEDKSVDDAIAFASKYYPTRHFLTDFNFGGQVIYKTFGKLPMFMDSRAGTVYTETQIQDYMDFMWDRNDWQPRINKYGVDAMMIDKTSLFAKAYENEKDVGQHHTHWKLVFAGKRANVYIARP